MGLSHRACMALEAMMVVACATRLEPISAPELAERMGISKRTLEPILQALTRCGLLSSSKGPCGGYGLAADRSRITALQIVEAVGGLRDEEDGEGSQIERQILRPLADRVRAAEAAVLATIPLSELKAQADRLGVAKRNPSPVDYVI